MKKITYSPSYTIVITYECFNYCTYCNFRINPQLGDWLKLTKAKKTLEEISNKSISEILILSGEIHPRSPERKLWLQNIYYLCEIALSMNFLPHINVGLLTYTEIKILTDRPSQAGMRDKNHKSKKTKSICKSAGIHTNFSRRICLDRSRNSVSN